MKQKVQSLVIWCWVVKSTFTSSSLSLYHRLIQKHQTKNTQSCKNLEYVMKDFFKATTLCIVAATRVTYICRKLLCRKMEMKLILNICCHVDCPPQGYLAFTGVLVWRLQKGTSYFVSTTSLHAALPEDLFDYMINFKSEEWNIVIFFSVECSCSQCFIWHHYFLGSQVSLLYILEHELIQKIVMLTQENFIRCVTLIPLNISCWHRGCTGLMSRHN